MIQSMTGFGKSESLLFSKNISIEIRSLNSKNLDLNLRLPNTLKEFEPLLREKISKKLKRGKIDFNLTIENLNETNLNQINKTIIEDYINQLQQINKSEKTELLKIAIKLPDSIKIKKQKLENNFVTKIISLSNKVIDQVIKFRIKEGGSLKKDFNLRIKNLNKFLNKINNYDLNRKEKISSKLKKIINTLNIEIDKNRFEQELIYYIEKFDINEEKIRLESHLKFFAETLKNEKYNGKKLGFISQEIGREINTIGSKSNDLFIQKIVVEMKDELEKIKEQILNVL
ncbi:MAG: YicC family protein [Flavobacteriaceae bacterium TMED220]|nr:MAG: YicC family protein [Flavobacteriaceae bacterium TMED220]|tara:strand:+ start:728 stop:1585 length:858 start_codon:yes stop_codon:yes gene_type:complete